MSDMLELIRKLPDEIEEAFKFDIPVIDLSCVHHVIFGGMGGSAISGDLARIFLGNFPLPMETVRDYELPAYVGKDSLVIVSSYSGNTEESISLYKEALERGSQVLSITSDGELARLSEENGTPIVKIPGGFPPRAALGYLFVPIIRIFDEGGMKIPELIGQLRKLPDYLRKLQGEFESLDSLPLELSEKFYLRFPVIYTSRRLRPVAMRWKTQINENAKAFAHIDELPELDHNEITGMEYPRERVEQLWVVFIDDEDDHPRTKLRMQYTADIIRSSVMGISFVASKGDNLVERVFYLLYLGDYISLYLAKNYQVDPIAIPRIDELKRRLAR